MSSTPKALLVVFTEPSDKLPLTEYHDWYDNEHIPPRLTFPGIKNATRIAHFSHFGDEKPSASWGAFYDLDSLAVLKDPGYHALLTDAPAHEKSVFERIDFLDRRTYSVLETAPTSVRPGYPGLRPGNVLVFVSASFKPEDEAEFHKWYDTEHVPLLSKAPGWLRTRRFALEDSAFRGQPKDGEEPKTPPKFLAIHEFEGEEGLTSPQTMKAMTTEWRNKVWGTVVSLERKVFKVHNTFGTQ